MKKHLLTLISILTAAAVMIAPLSALAADDGLILWYTFDEGFPEVKDASGNGNDGTLSDPATITAVPGKIGNAVALDGQDDYVMLPKGIMKDVTDFTITSWAYLNNNRGYQRIFDIGNSEKQYLFLSPFCNDGFRFSIKNESTESKLIGGSIFKANRWHHIAVVFSGKTGKLYLDGAVVATNNDLKLTPADLGETVQNYLGKSQFAVDAYCNGKIDDFRIYKRALSDSEILQIYSSAQTDRVVVSDFKRNLTIGNTYFVDKDFSLPTSPGGGINITWESSNEDVVSSTGKINRKDDEIGYARLVATIRKGDVTDKKVFDVSVKPLNFTDYSINIDLSKKVEAPNTAVFTSPSSLKPYADKINALLNANNGDTVYSTVINNILGKKSGKVGVGSWATEVAFDDLLVTSNEDGSVLFSEDFSSGKLPSGMADNRGGEWGIVDGAMTETLEEPSGGCYVYFGDSSWNNYTYTLKAKKIKGSEGFMIPFLVRDSKNVLYWNIGGSGNTVSVFEGSINGTFSRIGKEVPFKVEQGVWYNIKLVVDSSKVDCYLNDNLMQSVNLDSPQAPLYTTVVYDGTNAYLKVANSSANDLSARINISGRGISGSAQVTEIRTEGPVESGKVAQAPVQSTKELSASESFVYTFPKYSFTLIKLGTN